MIKQIVPVFLLLLTAGTLSAAEVLRVVSLNPIATDLARQVGGDAVEVVELMKPGQDPHVYAPSPSDLKAAEGAALILAMGKGLETYLDDLRETLQPGQSIFEIGRMIPSLRIEAGMELFACCPAHAHGVADPHWWHSVRNMRRAARLTADAFAKALPAESAAFRERATTYDKRLAALESWTKQELGRIPPARRRLTTAHAAFNYFCEDYRFKPVPVLGLSTLDQPRPGQMRLVLDTLAAEGVRVIFPENSANPALLETVAREAGVRLGGTLLAGSPLPEAPTFEAMFRHNVEAMVKALATEDEVP
jgi:zinc/manganese transport system substrate-binding protein